MLKSRKKIKFKKLDTIFILLNAGSTIQAVYYLEKSGLRASLMEAVQAATMKSKQTGRKE